MKQDIDIERLLVWAYRDQKADKLAQTRFTPSGPNASLTSAIGELMQLGCRVDKPSRAEIVLGAESIRAAMPDLEVIDRAVMSLDEHWIDEAGQVWPREAVQRRAGNACVVVLDGIEYPVTQACVSVQVILSARQDTPPEWHPEWREPRGRPAHDDAASDRRGRKRAVYDGPTAAEVCHARAIYATWHAALCVLAHELGESLAAWRPLAPRAAQSPWHSARYLPKYNEAQPHEIAA